ncbi:MAG: sugar phosphate isomerase/epimerase [SAR202 cluster bacterium]|nr:sugar phosphate isomerase/epimerase [SAR202 cluster bacterium]
MKFKLGYSTYALKAVDPFVALPRIREVGYEALEICLSEAWPTTPARFPAAERKLLARLARDLGFPSPILFGNIDVCAPAEGRAAMLKSATEKFQMARDLHYDDTPILMTTTAGHSMPGWERGKFEIRDAFLRLADVAAAQGVTIAIEPHAGTEFETPEKAVWLVQEVKHPNIKLDLDVSHFYVEGATVEHSIDLCASHSVMVHIKDGRKVAGKVEYCLTGAGTIDLNSFVRALARNNLRSLPIYAEISVQQSNRPDYDPWWTAKFCFDALDRACKAMAGR